MSLLTVDDPEGVIAQAGEGPQQLPLVWLPGAGIDRCLLKLGGIYGCCEVLGYQLASRLCVPVMSAVPIWCPREFQYEGQRAGAGRIGLAVQYVEAFHCITWEEAVSQAPQTVARSLALCLLDRCEWWQFAVTPFGLVFYDLERLFPAFCPERLVDQTWDDVADEVARVADAYGHIATSFANEVACEAARLGVTESLRSAVADAAAISGGEFQKLFDLQPHPLATQIAEIAANVAITQFRCASRLLSV